MNKYHFTISMQFKRDIDVNTLGEIFKLQPSSTVCLNESKGKVKTAKFVYKTKELDEIYTDQKFEKFVKSVKPNLEQLPQILEKNDGRCVFRVVFTQMDEKPCLCLSNEVMIILSNLNCSYDVELFM